MSGEESIECKTSILAINSGSSSIKFKLFNMQIEQLVAAGRLEGIGSKDANLLYARASEPSRIHSFPAPDHATALSAVFSLLEEEGLVQHHSDLGAIGHRVVHGGERYRAPALIDEKLITYLEAISKLAPLHNVTSLKAMRLVHENWPDMPQIAVFDTALHHDLPEHARYYGLSLKLQREHHIRRYGFHGLSHHHVAVAAANWLERPLDELKIISLHLGNGASACAIANGHSVDTSMGFTPLEGLVMGSRCGDLDPALPGYLAARLGLDGEALERLLQERSGLRGLCGDSDMRRIEQRMAGGDSEARLAFDIFCYRIRKYIGAYFAVLNGLDALVFTAGIGEHSVAVRSAVCADMEALGIAVDPVANAKAGDGISDISLPKSPVRVLVVPTDEELEIARATITCLRNTVSARVAPGQS